MVCSFFASIQYLWYLYYTAAYAVALRRIHAAEETETRRPITRLRRRLLLAPQRRPEALSGRLSGCAK
jgi:hypothetical protein